VTVQTRSTTKLTQEADSFVAILPKEATWNGKNKPAAEVPNVEENVHTQESTQVGDIEILIH
jgi:hypothetical protein